MGNLRFQLVDNVLILCHNKKPPEDQEWEDGIVFLREAWEKTERKLVSIIFTPGGAPTTYQRRRHHEELADLGEGSFGRNYTCAVLTTSIFVRGVITAYNWFGRKIKAFGPNDVEGALNYLNVPLTKRDVIQYVLAKMKKELGIDL